MNQNPQARTKPTNPYADLVAADCKHWQSLIGRVNEPQIAQLLVEYLDSEPDLRAKRSGVYLAAHETLERAAQAAEVLRAREERIASYGRMAAFLAKGVVKFVRWSAVLLYRGSKASIDVMSEARKATKAAPRSEPASQAQAQRAGTDLTFPKIDPLPDGLGAFSDAPLQSGAKILPWPHIQWPEELAAGQAAVH